MSVLGLSRIDAFYRTPMVTVNRAMKAYRERKGQKQLWRNRTLEAVVQIINEMEAEENEHKPPKAQRIPRR